MITFVSLILTFLRVTGLKWFNLRGIWRGEMSRHFVDEDGTSIFVKGLSTRTSVFALKEIFRKFGNVVDVYLPRNYHTGDRRGFAYIQYDDPRDADTAVREMDDTEIEGRVVHVSHARGRRKTPGQMKDLMSNSLFRRGGRGRFDDDRYSRRGGGFRRGDDGYRRGDDRGFRSHRDRDRDQRDRRYRDVRDDRRDERDRRDRDFRRDRDHRDRDREDDRRRDRDERDRDYHRRERRGRPRSPPPERRERRRDRYDDYDRDDRRDRRNQVVPPPNHQRRYNNDENTNNNNISKGDRRKNDGEDSSKEGEGEKRRRLVSRYSRSLTPESDREDFPESRQRDEELRPPPMREEEDVIVNEDSRKRPRDRELLKDDTEPPFKKRKV